MLTANGLAKLAEECGEVQQVIGKVWAYGLGDHPDGSEPLRFRLEDEIADVLAACKVVMDLNCLNHDGIASRMERKYKIFHEWARNENA